MAAVAKSKDPEKMEVHEEEEEDTDREESMDEEESEAFTVQVGTTYSCKRQDGTYHEAKVTKTRMNKRAGREEYYVNYVGLNCRLNEWVDKTRLELVKPVEEEEEEEEEDIEDVENVEKQMEEETSANGGTALENKSEEDEPESKKPKMEILETSTSSSVVAPEDLAEELTCLLCNKIFNDPVVVECGHNFCRSCIDQAWESQDSFTCPDCKEVLTDKRFTTNRILANLVKKAIGVAAPANAPAAVLTPAKSITKTPSTINCLVHDERLKLFCKDDGDLGCVICRESLKHASHNFLPISDAMGVYRGELSSIVTPLEEALKLAEQMAKQQNEKIERHKAHMLECRSHVEAEFEKLHKLLKEREEQLLGKLQEEGGSLLKEMEANIARIEDNIEDIKNTIDAASYKLEDNDSISFLTGIKTFIKKCEEHQKEALSSGNAIIDKQLNKATYMAPIDFSISGDSKITPAPSQKAKQIWIIGNALINCAARRAKSCSFGQDLGFKEKNVTVCWMGKGLMMWRDLVMEIDQTSHILGVPSIVVIHLGVNDLERGNHFKLFNSVRIALPKLCENYPNTKFVWSQVLPKREWIMTHMDQKRKKFNSFTTAIAEEHGIGVVTHQEIDQRMNSLHGKSFVRITDVELDIFNTDLKDYLTKIVSKLE